MTKEKIDMQISKVKLVDDGSRGIEVIYNAPEKRGSFDFNNEHTVKYKAPVNTELKVAVAELRQHIIDICRIDSRYRADVEVTGVSSNATSQFVITAKVRSDGDTTFALNTPLIKDETGYAKFEEAISIIQDIYDRVKDYVEKRLMATPQQIVMAFEKDNKDFDKGEFDELSEEMQIERATQLLSKKGHLVLPPDEITESDEGGFGGENVVHEAIVLPLNGAAKSDSDKKKMVN